MRIAVKSQYSSKQMIHIKLKINNYLNKLHNKYRICGFSQRELFLYYKYQTERDKLIKIDFTVSVLDYYYNLHKQLTQK